MDQPANIGDHDRVVSLRVVDAANRESVESLAVSVAQQSFVDGVADSLAEAEARPEGRPWPRAIYLDDEPVGFLMLSDGVEPGRSDFRWPYYLWRMMIDHRYQGQGIGRRALDELVAYLRTRPGAKVLVTSIVMGEGSPLGFYLRYGFRQTGEMWDHEHLLELDL